VTDNITDKEEAAKEDAELGLDYDDEDEEEEWEGDVDWNAEETPEESGEVHDESSAYLEFVKQQALKVSKTEGDEEGDEFDDAEDFEEENMLETPLDKVEPFALLKDALMRKFISHVPHQRLLH